MNFQGEDWVQYFHSPNENLFIKKLRTTKKVNLLLTYPKIIIPDKFLTYSFPTWMTEFISRKKNVNNWPTKRHKLSKKSTTNWVNLLSTPKNWPNGKNKIIKFEKEFMQLNKKWTKLNLIKILNLSMNSNLNLESSYTGSKKLKMRMEFI